MNRRNPQAGFTLIELLVALGLFAILLGTAFPAFQSIRHAAAFDRAEQQLVEVLHRGRWSAITSGRPATTVELVSPTVVSVRDGGTVLSTIDVGELGVTLAATTATFDFDGRGLVAGVPPAFTLTSARLSASRTVTVSPLGAVEPS